MFFNAPLRVIEDLHLAIEIFIESAFEIAHKAGHFLLSSSEVCRKVVALISSNGGAVIDNHDGNIDLVFRTATIGDADPTPTERRCTLHYSLDTDARTCQDVITELEWVSNGVVGSPAFAAFDQGYDVFLGNLRGLVSREHVDSDTNISSRKYWRYSINEHATKDIPAMIEKIHEIKASCCN